MPRSINGAGRRPVAAPPGATGERTDKNGKPRCPLDRAQGKSGVARKLAIAPGCERDNRGRLVQQRIEQTRQILPGKGLGV